MPACRRRPAPPVSWLTAAVLATFVASAAAQCVDYHDFAHLVGRSTLPSAVVGLVADAGHAYATTSDQRVLVLDMADPADAQPLAGVDLGTSLGRPILRGSTVFAPSRGVLPGVSAVDVSTPGAPVQVGGLAIADGVQFLAAHGQLILAQRHLSDTVDVIDAGDPAAMAPLGSFPLDGNAIISGGGDLVYARARGGFEVWDLADPTAPILRGSLTLPATIASRTMAMAGPSHVLLPSAGFDDVDILDVSDPDAPFLSGSISMRYTPVAVLVDGDLAYVTLNSGAVDIVGIADLGAPVFLGSLTGGAYNGAALSGHHLVCAGNTALSVFDIAGAALIYPTVGTYNWGWGFSYDAERYGDHVYLASDLGLQVFDVSDPAAPLITFGAGNPNGVALQGDHLYVSDTNGLTVYGLANPGVPNVLNVLARPWWPGAPELEAAAGLLVVSLRDSLVSYDLSDPTAPQRLGSRPLQVNTFEIDGGLVYALSDTALHILDLGVPGALPEVGRVGQPDGEDLAVGGGFAYICQSALADGLLLVMDVQDPANPQLAHSETGIYLRGLSLHGDLLLGTQGGWGVQLLAVSDPTQPTYHGHLYHGYDVGWAYRARVVGDLVWVGNDEGVAFLPQPCVDEATTAPDPQETPREGLGVSCYPNPFNPRMAIGFRLAHRAPVAVTVVDLRGRSVKRLLVGATMAAGAHSVDWFGDDEAGRPVASGVYMVRVVVGQRQAMRKVSLVRWRVDCGLQLAAAAA